jgi:hypothetical protein
MKPIVLLDPSLPGVDQTEPDNLGDVIIKDAVERILRELFPHAEITRLPTKRPLSGAEVETVRRSAWAFLGGTNLFSADLATYNQWSIDATWRSILWPKFTGVIALGVGWWQYQGPTTTRTRLFYKRILSRNYTHSVRDHYTENRLHDMGVSNVLNTSCPTVWELNGLPTKRRSSPAGDIVFTLTDYARNVGLDNRLIETLLDHASGKLFFFPQGSRDVEYIESLATFRSNRSEIETLPRNVRVFNALAATPGVTYVGTRLHGGIRFLQYGRDALIICVDNRAAEIHNDVGLPAVQRDDFASVGAWLDGAKDFGEICAPLDEIGKWKSQFSSGR